MSICSLLRDDEGAALAPFVWEPLEHSFTKRQLEIIEDAVLFNPERTDKLLREKGIDLMSRGMFLAKMQDRFDYYDEESDELVKGNMEPLEKDDICGIAFLLGHSQFFEHELHRQSHIEPNTYHRAADALEKKLGINIPR